MIEIKGCTSDVIADISEFIGSLSIDDVEEVGCVKTNIDDVPLYDIKLSERCVLFYHSKEVIIQKSVEESARFALADFRFQAVIIR